MKWNISMEIFKKIYDFLGDISENDQKVKRDLFLLEIVGYLDNRDRLDH